MPDVCPVSRFSSVGTNGYMGYPSDFLRLNRNDPGIDSSPPFPLIITTTHRPTTTGSTGQYHAFFSLWL